MKTAAKFFAAVLFTAFTAFSALAQTGSSLPAKTSGEVLFTLPPDPYGGLGKAEDPVPAMARLKTGFLPSGLRYYILQNSQPSNRAYLTLAVKAGSLMESDGERGIAHFVEHMAFKGTRRFPGEDLINYLRSLGMRWGPEVNAYTYYDKTVYGIESTTETGPDGLKRIPQKALEIIDDWTWAVSFNPTDVDAERSIILEEYRTDLGATERMRKQILPVIFRGSRYADRDPIGLPEIIRNVSATQLARFYKKWYRSDNMAVIFAGDFDAAELEKEIVAYASSPQAQGAFKTPSFELPPPEPGNITVLEASDPEMSASYVYLYYKRSPKEIGTDLRFYRESIIDYLVSSMIGVRNQDEALRPSSPFVAAGAWGADYGKSSRYYVMAAQSKLGRASQSFETLLNQKEVLQRVGFSENELNRAKASLLSFLDFQASEKDKRESNYFIESLTEDFLSGGVTPDIDWELDAARRILPSITLQTVNAAVSSYFADDDLTVLFSVPQSEADYLPTEGQVKETVRDYRNMAAADLTLPEDGEDRDSLVEQAPEAGAIVSEDRDPSGALIWTLSNGATVIVRETANRNNEVSLYAMARGGETSVPLEDNVSAYLASEIAQASGLGNFSRSELSKTLQSKHVALSFWTDSYSRGFTGGASANDIETLFQLLYLHFTDPKIDKNGFDLVLQNRRTRITQEKDDPEVVFSKELTRTVYGGNPRFMPLELEDLDKVTPEKAAAFLAKSLNPSDYTFVFVGSLGAPQHISYSLMRGFTETWLASIPQTGAAPWTSWDDPHVQRPAAAQKTVRKGKESKSMVYLAWFAPAAWTEKDNAASLVLDNYLDIVLNDEIRINRGGVYSVSENFTLTPIPAGELSLGVYFICDPAREGELREAVKQGLSAIAAGSIDAESFSRAREARLKGFESNMETNAFIARNLASFRLIQEAPLSRLWERPQLYGSVTMEDIRQIAARALARGPVELVLLPENADN